MFFTKKCNLFAYEYLYLLFCALCKVFELSEGSFGCATFMQVDGGVVLPDKTSLRLTAIEDAEYKEDKIECKFIGQWVHGL